MTGTFAAKGAAVRGTRSRQPAPGDVVVTKVGDRYHIGQVHGARIVLTPIAMRTERDDAFALAFRFVTRRQRVFLYGSKAQEYLLVACAKPP